MPKKLTDPLVLEDTAPTSDDMVMVVHDPAGTPASKKVTLLNFGKALDHGAFFGLADNDHPQYTTDAEATTLAAAEVTTHEAAADPHTVYRLESDIIVVRPNETKTNSTTADQDFASVFTTPANYLVAGKILRLSFLVQYITDGSASTQQYYLKLGTTKVYTTGASTPPNSATRSLVFQFLVFGTAAAGAAVNVDTSIIYALLSGAGVNTTIQPVALATNGTLAVVLGMAFGTATGGESSILVDAMIEKN